MKSESWISGWRSLAGVLAVAVLALGLSLKLEGAPPAPPKERAGHDSRSDVSRETAATKVMALSPSRTAPMAPAPSTSRVQAGSIPADGWGVVSVSYVDYRDDRGTRERAAGKLFGPLPSRGNGNVAAGCPSGFCSFDIECDDGNKCTNDRCDLPAGQGPCVGTCAHPLVPNGEPGECDDGVFCNGKEYCQDGACHAGVEAACCSTPPNQNSCTESFPRCSDDAANAGAGCRSDADCVGGACEHCQPACTQDSNCDDGVKCNGAEKCVGNSCVRGKNPCGTDAICFEGACTNQNPLKRCNSDSDCLAGHACNKTGPVQCLCGRCCVPNASEFDCSNNKKLSECTTTNAQSQWYPGDNAKQQACNAQYCGGRDERNQTNDDWGCPKYGRGITQHDAANPPTYPVVVGPISDSAISVPPPGGPGTPLNQLGDDYTLSKSSYMGLDVMRFVGGALNGNRISMDFYDAGGKFVEDIVLQGLPVGAMGIHVVVFTPALTIPPSGYVVMRTAEDFEANTRFVWFSTTDSNGVGTNDADKLWVNGAAAANFLPSPNPGILAFELVGDNVLDPTGACCNKDTGDCEDGVVSWVCVDRGDGFNGLGSRCSGCNGGSHASQTCRKCVLGANAGQPCTSDAFCGTPPGPGTCEPDSPSCPPVKVCSTNLAQVCALPGDCPEVCSNAPTTICVTPASDCPKGCSNAPGTICVNPATDCPPSGATCVVVATCSATATCSTGGVCSNNSSQNCITSGDCSGGGICNPPACVPLASCDTGACCSPTTGDCTRTTQGGCPGTPVNFKGFGSSCDADGGYEAGQQHCCPQPTALQCMGGPNNLQACTVDTDCGRCTAGITAGSGCGNDAACSTPAENGVCTAGMCVGGLKSGGGCLNALDCQGSVCDGRCVTRSTGADNCQDALVHVITVPDQGDPPRVVTISGNNIPATTTFAHPDTCNSPSSDANADPGWWEAFSIDKCARVRIDYCCSDPVLQPAYPGVIADCHEGCKTFLGYDTDPYVSGQAPFFRGPRYCAEDNLWFTMGMMSAGTYWIPIYSALAGAHGNYQVHVTVDACPAAACCHLECSVTPQVCGPSLPSCPGSETCESKCHELPQFECDAKQGFYLGPPQLPIAVAQCVGEATCQNGSCCTGPGQCKDSRENSGNPMNKGTCESAFSGNFIGGVNCKGATCVGGNEDGLSCNNALDCPTGFCDGDAAHYAQPNPCPICQIGGAGNCQAFDDAFEFAISDRSLGTGVVAADDFTLPADGTIDTVCVWGFYLDNNEDTSELDCGGTFGGNPKPDKFRVRIYADANGLPGALVGESDCTSDRAIISNAITTSKFTPPVDTYGFQLVLINPIGLLLANQCYWLEVSNDTGDAPSSCYWVWTQLDPTSSVGNKYSTGGSEATGYPPGSEKQRDQAFCLNKNFAAGGCGDRIRACCPCSSTQNCSEKTWNDCNDGSAEWIVSQSTCTNFTCPTEPPANDHCAAALVVPVGSYTFQTFCAGTDGYNPVPNDSGTAGILNDLWFNFTATQDCDLVASMCPTGIAFDSEIALYSDPDPAHSSTCPCPTNVTTHLATFIQGGDENCSENAVGGPAFVGTHALKGHCYTIRVGGYPGPSVKGIGQVDISCGPAVCGDNRKNGTDVCDGTDDAACPGGCHADCTCGAAAVCGDGFITGREECDPNAGPTGCIEPSLCCRIGDLRPECQGRSKCTCTPECGNNNIETEEDCDLPHDDACPGLCGVNAPPCHCPQPECGNGIVEAVALEKCEFDRKCSGAPHAPCTLDSGCAPGTCDYVDRGDCADQAPCRKPGDPLGGCECACPPLTVVNNIVWDPAKSCASGLNVNQICATDADCRVCSPVTTKPGRPCTSNADCPGGGTCPPGPPPGSCTLWPSNNSEATTRSLVFTVTGPPGPSKVDAIRVCMVDLQTPVPPNAVQFPPQNFHAFDLGSPAACASCTAEACPGNAGGVGGCCRWVGPWGTFYESQGPPLAGPSIAARLQCTPYYGDWKSKGPIWVVGAEIMPSSAYSVQAYAGSCMGNEATCTCPHVSAPVTMYTRRSGDVEAPYNPPTNVPQPNAIDLAQVVNKFKSVVGAPVKCRAQLQPNVPELNADVNAIDIVTVVDAIGGKAYPYAGPCPCPSLMTCGSLAPPGGTPCATPAVCVALPALSGGGAGAMCVKTCKAPATNAGEPCINDAHCPGGGVGSCGNGGATPGFCRDKCGRCN